MLDRHGDCIGAHALTVVSASIWRARQRWQQACCETDIRAAAAVVRQTCKWAAAALELQSLRSCGYRLTDRGRAAIHEPEDIVA